MAHTGISGYVPFPISILFAPTAIAHLLRTGRAAYLLYGRDTEPLVEQVMREFTSENETSRLRCIEWLRLECPGLSDRRTAVKEAAEGAGLANRNTSKSEIPTRSIGRGPGRPAQLAHTTGSTSIPKIIPISHSSLLHSPSISGPGSSLILASLSQGYGLFIPAACLSHQSSCYVYSPLPTMTIPDLLRVLTIAIEKNAGMIDVLFASPRMLEALAGAGEAGSKVLRQFGRVVLGGAVPSRGLMAWTETGGLPVISFMGSMETGYLMGSGKPKSARWDWFEEVDGDQEFLSFERYELADPTGTPASTTGQASTTPRKTGDRPSNAAYNRPEEEINAGDNSYADCVSSPPLYELVVRPNHPRLNVINRPDGPYATGDLFVPHPTDKGKWQFWTRKDDVIVHSTGMKTDRAFSEFTSYRTSHSSSSRIEASNNASISWTSI